MSNNFDLQEYQLHQAILNIPGIGNKKTKSLFDHFKKPSAIISSSEKDLRALELFTPKQIKAILKCDYSVSDKSEIEFIEQNDISIICPYNNNYPERFEYISDAPTLLYARGAANLNHQKTVAIIGTRNNTDYGKKITQEIINQLAPYNVQIISGLADGIDGIAHKQAVDKNLSTIGVLGHGLDTMYPAHHKKLAKDMLPKGGIITEYPSRTIPHPANFPMRNRIVAALSDILLVVETKEKGGSMITAQLGFEYNKEIGAIPGSIHQVNSKGCNKLIKTNIAHLIESGDDILRIMGWLPQKKLKSVQQDLFIQLEPQQQMILDLLKENRQLHFDEILHKTQLPYSKINNILLQLEMQNLVASLPGKRYEAQIFI